MQRVQKSAWGWLFGVCAAVLVAGAALDAAGPLTITAVIPEFDSATAVDGGSMTIYGNSLAIAPNPGWATYRVLL